LQETVPDVNPVPWMDAGANRVRFKFWNGSEGEGRLTP